MATPPPSTPPRLDVTIIDIAACTDALSAEERATPRLSGEDVKRIETLAGDPLRQRAWKATRIATRLALERIGGEGLRQSDFAIAHGGRPWLAGAPHFNVSHSDGLALIAVADQPIGVDIERVRALPMAGDRRKRIVAAAARLGGGGPAEETTDLAVLAAWVRLEAVAKALGTGIGVLLTEEGISGGARIDNPNGARGIEVRNISVADGYVAAVAAPLLATNITVTRLPGDACGIARYLGGQP